MFFGAIDDNAGQVGYIGDGADRYYKGYQERNQSNLPGTHAQSGPPRYTGPTCGSDLSCFLLGEFFARCYCGSQFKP